MTQTVIVLVLVALCAAYVGRRVWATLRPKKAAGCDAGCGCGEADSGDDWAKT